MQRCIPYFHRLHRSSGFSLIEVLVTLVLLGIGLLGAQQMHANALRQHRESQQQARADQLAADLAERLRGHAAMAQLPAGPYVLDARLDQTPSLPADCISTPCLQHEQAAAHDMASWMQRVAQELPGARVQVCPDAQPLDAQGLPDWRCDGTSTGPIRLLAIKLGWPTRHDAEMVRPGTVLLASTGAPP
ncbi:type IV pilus modification protein PilV [Brachymonas denitrificans]|uniref:type IV pilus modification protein PilV n=1 Tax=Brachymonas denitrificans TaxID=28220 RepID=UPI00396A76F6